MRRLARHHVGGVGTCVAETGLFSRDLVAERWGENQGLAPRRLLLLRDSNHQLHAGWRVSSGPQPRYGKGESTSSRVPAFFPGRP